MPEIVSQREHLAPLNEIRTMEGVNIDRNLKFIQRTVEVAIVTRMLVRIQLQRSVKVAFAFCLEMQSHRKRKVVIDFIERMESEVLPYLLMIIGDLKMPRVYFYFQPLLQMLQS
jgi:hypothetical protein